MRDPLFQEMLKDETVDDRVREGLRADLTECRRIRAVMERQGNQWCASSIYEALLAILSFLPSGDDFVFRGHLDAQWRLIPSFFRMQPRISLMLYARTVYGAYRWAERAVGEPLSLTPFEAEAAAQHYGAGTTLLDVTESLRVAAYFATTPLRETEKRAERGSIYVLSWTFRIFYRPAGYPAAQKMSSEAMKCSASSMGRMVRPNGPALVQRSFHSDQ